ncbi:MAG: HupE/UreJ family protein [Pseudomonadota bacterium]
MPGWWRLACLTLLLLGSASAFAHKGSDSYLDVRQAGGLLEVRWDVALRDLDLELQLDSNQDRQLSWGEVRLRSQDISNHLLARLTLSQGAEPCQLMGQPAPLSITRHSDGAYIVLAFLMSCPEEKDALRIDYRLLDGIDVLHRGILTLHTGSQVRTAVLQPSRQPVTLSANASHWQTFSSFLHEGVHHLVTGYDHLLFLLCLLLPAPLVWRNKHWQPSVSGRRTFRDTVFVITAFTLAHSVTLALAALQIVNLPSQLVESVIAASIAIAALHNLRPVLTHRRWLLAGGFGLIHGFGFAGVLGELPLGIAERSVALAGFNIGVELGQLGFIALFLPVLWWMRHYPIYSRFIVPISSLLITFIALLWLAQRALNLQLIPG